jgi:aspartate aminotransferase-like enzyme
MYPETLAIGAEQTPYFRNETFSGIVLECEAWLLETLHAPEGSRVLFLGASGTGAMEAAVTNLVAPGEKVAAVVGGGFGARFAEIARFYGAEVTEIAVGDDALADTAPLSAARDASVLLLNAHETSVGLLYDVASVGRFCREHGQLFVVDAISMYVTDPLDMQGWGIDAVVLASQKGLALPPGLSMVVLSPRAQRRLRPSGSYYFDFARALGDGVRGQTPFTPPVTILLQLHQRLEAIAGHGIEAEQRRARRLAERFRAGIAGLPLAFYRRHMPNAMTALTPTDGRSAAEIVARMERRYGMVLTPNGGALADTVFRVGHMGAMTEADIDALIDALKDDDGGER